jgi:hypothetical protein
MTCSRKQTPRVASENTGTGRSRPRQPASENTEPSGTGRRGARPTALPAGPASVLERYAAALAGVPLAEETKRTYLSRVRMYLAWLASPAAARRPGGDPVADPRARDWAVRDYRHWLLREADPKCSARYATKRRPSTFPTTWPSRSASTASLYPRLPRPPCPGFQQGIPQAKDAWMLGIGLGLDGHLERDQPERRRCRGG